MLCSVYFQVVLIIVLLFAHVATMTDAVYRCPWISMAVYVALETLGYFCIFVDAIDTYDIASLFQSQCLLFENICSQC